MNRIRRRIISSKSCATDGRKRNGDAAGGMQHARSKRFKSLSFGALTDIILRAREGAFICYICRDCLDVIEGPEVAVKQCFTMRAGVAKTHQLCELRKWLPLKAPTLPSGTHLYNIIGN